MERLLVLRLEAAGCEAEAWLNGVPLLRVRPAEGAHAVAQLPVHEFTLQGTNELELRIGAPGAAPEPKISDGRTAAGLRLLLPRVGSVASPASARTLAQIDWAPAAGEVCETPHALPGRVELPIAFPRWGWLDAPPIAETPALAQEVAAWLLPIVAALVKGNPEPFIQACRLRLEDHAVAYQRKLADEVARLRTHLAALHAEQPLAPALPSAAKLKLRPVAGGRLVEVLAGDGMPFLQSEGPAGARLAWPLRLARVDGRFYVLR